MTPPNPTPTRRTEPLRGIDRREFAAMDRFALEDEIVRLRAERAAMIRRVEALKPGDWITREDLLAALRDGGTDGR